MQEKDFDQLVQHTLLVALTDGSTLVYTLLPKAKGELMGYMRSLTFGHPDVLWVKILWFEAIPERIVFINTRYLLNLTFCFDSPSTVVGAGTYHDNFAVRKDIEGFEDVDPNEIPIPQVILKLAHPIPLAGSRITTISDLDPGALFNLDVEAGGPPEALRQFIELEDEDGEPNFFNLDNVMCLEAARDMVNVEDFETDEDDEV